MQNQNLNLVLSTDAKPRLKWTPELHQRFIEAISQLGGADKATPKSLMRVMGIPGLTLYHLKSHLQKYRLGKSQQSQSLSLASIENKQEDYMEIQSSNCDSRTRIAEGNQHTIDESFQISQALQMQMEVQRKLQEQIEVQRHLQLRIEAQGKYLQSVLRKAQETLSTYNSSSSSMGIELAKAELSRLVSMVNDGCPSSSISELTEIRGSSLKEIERKQMRGTVCSVDSSLTSSESSGRNEEMEKKNENGELPLMEIQPQVKPLNNHQRNQVKKRICSIFFDGICVEKPVGKRSRNGEKLRIFDLNNHYQNDFESVPRVIDLNLEGN